MTQQQAEAYAALDAKRNALYSYAQKLAQLTTDANHAEVAPDIQRADLERQLCESIISELLQDAPVAFPSHDDLTHIERLAAALQHQVVVSNDVAALLVAADAVISAWPNPQGG